MRISYVVVDKLWHSVHQAVPNQMSDEVWEKIYPTEDAVYDRVSSFVKDIILIKIREIY